MNVHDSEPFIDSMVNNDLKDLPFFIKHRWTDFHFRMNYHSHNGYELYIVHEGSGNFLTDSRIYPIDGVHVFLIGENEIHKPIIVQGQKYTRTVINFLPEFLQSSTKKKWLDMFDRARHPDKMHIRLNAKEHSHISAILSRMHEEYSTREYGFDQMLSVYLNRLLFEIYRLLHSGKEPDSKATPSSPNTIVENIINYLSEHYAEDVSLDELAKMFFITPYYLCHLFKKTTGDTISKFILYTRIHHAKRLLTHSDLTISDIAMKIGFNSSPYFGMVFKKHLEMTPKQFRTKYRQASSKGFDLV